MVRTPAEVMTWHPGPPCSHNSCRHRPHGINQATATTAVQVRDHPALGAQRDSVGRVLDVAAGDDAPVVDEAGHSNRETAVWRVGPPHRLNGTGAQQIPVDGYRGGH